MPTNELATRTSTPMEDRNLRMNVLAIVSLPIWDLAELDDKEALLARAKTLPPQDLAMIVAAANEAEHILAPERENPVWIVDRLTEIATLISINASEDQINHWARIAIVAIKDLPAELLQEALDSAIKKCRWANEVVPFLHDEVEQLAARPRKHLRILTRIIEAAERQDP